MQSLLRVDSVDTFKEKTRYTRILFDSRAFVRTALTAPALAMSQKSGARQSKLRMFRFLCSKAQRRSVAFPFS